MSKVQANLLPVHEEKAVNKTYRMKKAAELTLS
jgi:hypothetical protein